MKLPKDTLLRVCVTADKKFWVYIIECSDDSYYVGYTCDLRRRLREHKEGRGSKYVAGRLPFNLVYNERFNSRSEAMKREAEIKRIKRKKKEKLVKGSG